MDRRLLSIYLNDHLAGSTAGVSLAQRLADQNRGNRFGIVTDRLAHEIEEDRDQLIAIMERLGVRRNRLKVAAGSLGEYLGRLKTNGSMRAYSPLSRLVELEAMALGVEGKRSLWRSLQRAFGDSAAGIDLDRLEQRAHCQYVQLERLRLDAAELAFSAGLSELGHDAAEIENTKAAEAHVAQPPS